MFANAVVTTNGKCDVTTLLVANVAAYVGESVPDRPIPVSGLTPDVSEKHLPRGPGDTGRYILTHAASHRENGET